MKKKLLTLFLTAMITISAIPFSSNIYAIEYNMENLFPNEIFSSSYYNKEVDYSLWDKFLKYDLCITDYNSLTEEQKELCKFIFETERSAKSVIRCERARKTLAGDTNLGDRITVESLYGINAISSFYTDYIDHQDVVYCTPDIKHFDFNINVNEYWLDDEGNERVLFDGENELTTHYGYFGYYKYDDEMKSILDSTGYTYPRYTNISSFLFDDDRYCLAFPDKSVMSYTLIKTTPSPKMENNSYFVDDDVELIKKDNIYYTIMPDNTAMLFKSDFRIENYLNNNEPINETIIIPDEVNGYPVTAIKSFAFYNSGITKIELPETIAYIGDEAFCKCKFLEEINFPKSLKSIAWSAFSSCDSLTNIIMDCPELELSKWQFNCSEIKSATLKVKSIGEYSFANCSKLEKVILNEGLESIESSAFLNCNNLKNIQFPSSLKYIGQEAFTSTAINSLVIPSTIKVIGKFPHRTDFLLYSIGQVLSTDPLTDECKLAVNPDCTICGYTNTEAEFYAKEWNLKFIDLDSQTEKWDINLDGETNSADIVLMYNYLHGKATLIPQPIDKLDLNGDAAFNVFDVILLKRTLLKNS